MNKLENNLLEKKCKMVGIDLDSSSAFDLLRTYLHARKLFPEAKINVQQSSSGLGFHILITLEEAISNMDNILKRAILNDDTMRVSLSLKKLSMSDGEEKYPDLIFDEKNKHKVRPIDINEMLKEHKEKINHIIDNWGSGEALETMHNVAKEIEPKIEKIRKRVYMTCITFSGDKLKEKLKEISTDIFEKDPSFKWRIYQSYFPKYDYLFTVFSDNENKAIKRGGWLKWVIKKELDIDLFYWVKRKK